MKLNYRLVIVCAFVLVLIVGCSSFGNPFVGKWESGAFNLEFNSDKTFELSMGNVVTLNLEGNYSYDKEILSLDGEGESELLLSYEFKDGGKTLVLKPEGESSFINTKVEFTRK